ncbi:hypothetical protein AAFF_G00189120 [Aldrovandia affinis]|uniref:LINE-1 type transposase domain-containing protein 1 n=1 Tax=Aldrovandia affinis TaxID=143900 RepID=A0AAD7RK08_9TELE|nr:hypothetical protein AAFF_G00189120 [Aldrovandia affinis]
MSRKRTEGTSKEEKIRQAPSPNASNNGDEPPDRPPQWFISEMEKGVLRIESVIEGRLTKLSETMEKILSDNEVFRNRIKCIEGKQSEFVDSLTAIQQEFDDYRKATEGELKEMRECLDDQENRARRQNLRLVGFPEGVEGKNAVAFIQEWLPKILGLEGETFEVERAHRSLQQRPADGARPRAIVIQLLRFSDTVKIVDAARNKGSLQFGNSTVMIFRDMSTALYQKRKAFIPLKRKLKEKNVTFRLLHPTTFTMDLEGGKRTFTTPQAAENYLKKYHPDLVPRA